ncbi:MAG: D-alanyl-lipoteichoic acid biosynthesis protein DltD [Chloroflexi bacterium]|nr:D-alanyl-lipoteichoic acid biosynthesis protein DltD [Chloroflexota bacterium]
MKQAPHLAASVAAVFVSIMAGVAFTIYANLFEEKYVHSVAALEHIEIIKGSAIQRVALQQDDLLVVYGGSEIVLLQTRYQAYRFFSTYPTGFNVFDVANKGASALTMAQKVAALGEDVRGKKVVISITPAIVTMAPLGEVNPDHYNANFSQLHALELAFSPHLSMETKRLAAKRMLDFPAILEDNLLLKFTLENLAGDSTTNRILYYLAWPLGRLQIAFVTLQDHYATTAFIRSHSSEELRVTRQPEEIDWSALAAKAEVEQIENTDSNSYGVDNLKWKQLEELFVTPIAAGSKDAEFIEDVKNAREWGDLEITLRVLHELGADAVIFSNPMNVQLWEKLGVSEEAQNAYYEKINSMVSPYNIPVVDYREYGTDKYFDMDLAAHTSRKGWVYVNQTLDKFFHGVLR